MVPCDSLRRGLTVVDELPLANVPPRCVLPWMWYMNALNLFLVYWLLNPDSNTHIIVYSLILNVISRASVAQRQSVRTGGREVPRSKFAWATWFFLQAKKLFGTAWWPSSLRMIIGRPSPHHFSSIRRAPIHPTVKWVPGACARGGNCSPRRWVPTATRFSAHVPNFPFFDVWSYNPAVNGWAVL